MIVYVDMDDTLCEYTKAHNVALRENPSVKFPQSQYGFFEGLEPIEGAIESMNKLKQSNNHTVYILTAPSIQNPLCYTEKRVWVEKHLGYSFVDRLIISPNKGLLKGDFLVDDFDSGKGQEFFEGEVLVIGSSTYPKWSDILNKLNL